MMMMMTMMTMLTLPFENVKSREQENVWKQVELHVASMERNVFTPPHPHPHCTNGSLYKDSFGVGISNESNIQHFVPVVGTSTEKSTGI